MKRINRSAYVALTLAFAFGLAGTSALWAQEAPAAASVVPPLIKFNGVIATTGAATRTSDAASARQVTATFSLYELQEGGSPLWSESQKVQLDEQGRYMVLLGATSSAGLPLDLFTSGKALWLGVQPQLSGAGELPRVLLVAVPYALKASDSDTLGGKPASAYALAGAPAVVEFAGASAPPSASANSAPLGSKVDAAAGKDLSVQPLAACSAVTSDGTATANAVAKFTTACNVENSLIRDNGTGVVVGGTAPGALFDVQFTSTATSSTPVFGQRVLSTLNPAAASSVQALGFYSDALTKSGNAQNITGSLFAGVLETDHYGTGTLTQAYGMNDNVLNRGTGTITNAYGILSSVSNLSTGKITNGYGVYVTPPENATGGTISNYSGVYISSPSAVAGAYGLYSAGGKNYFAGDVGIGTTTPAANLEVNGTAKFDGAVTFAGTDTITGKQLISTVATGTAPLTVSSTTMVPNLNAALLGGLAASAFQPVGSYATLAANTFTGNQTVKGYAAIDGDTRVDFNNLNTGTNTPALRFGSGSTGEGIGSDRVGTVNVKGIDFYTNSMPRMSITNAGFVGIGTATPGAFLDVEGGTSTSGVGGGVWLVGQTGLLSNNGGAIVLRAGPGGYNGTEDSVGGSGGNININGGNAGSGEGCCGKAGSVAITGGTGGSANSANGTTPGGSITIQGGPGGNDNGAYGNPGNVILAPGGSNYPVGGGKVGIGTTSPDNMLTVNGTADKPAGGSWGTFSDRRLKTVDGDFKSGLSQVLNLNPIRYRYNDDNPMGIRSPGEHIGVVAQEVQKVIPEAVSENSKGYLIVNNDPIIWSMLNAIKEQQSLIRTQQARAQTQQKQAQVQQARARAQQAEIDKLKSDLAQQKKQAEVQQTAMTQLLAQVRGIQATLAVDRQDRPNPQVAGTVAHKATKPVVMHSSGQAAPSLVAKVRF